MNLKILQINADNPAVEIKFIHSAGPGGQNVNKVATAAQLRFDLARSGLDELQLSRLRRLAPKRISQDGFLTITARTSRSQKSNKDDALSRLNGLLERACAPPPKPRKATRPTKRAVERRLSSKKLRSKTKLGRSIVKDEN